MNKDFQHHIISDLAEFNPEKIILFGSYARGNWDEESDIDIIVVYRTEKKFMDRLEELYVKWNFPKAIDILAYTPDEFTEMMKNNESIRPNRETYRFFFK